MAFVESFDVFMSDFAQTVEIGPIGQETSIQAIFDNKFFEITDGGFAPIHTTEPMITCVTSQLAAANAVQNTRVVVASVEYYITALKPDGTGITEVELHRA
jgi:hypothetical protein